MILAARTATTAASIRADMSFRQAVAFADPTSRARKKSAATIAGRYTNGTSAQKSVPRRSVCTAGERDEFAVVKLGRNARKKRIVRGFDMDIAIPRRKSRMPRAVAGRSALGDESRKLRIASAKAAYARYAM